MSLQLKSVNVNGKEYQVPALYQTYGNGTGDNELFTTYNYTWVKDFTTEKFTITCEGPSTCNSKYISIKYNSRNFTSSLIFNLGYYSYVEFFVDKNYSTLAGYILDASTEFTEGGFAIRGCLSLNFEAWNGGYPFDTTFTLSKTNELSSALLNTVTGTITVKFMPPS
jgi:hypothetical protein